VKDLLRYGQLMEQAARGVVRQVLAQAATQGLPGAHHFYITFRTRFPGVALPDHLLAKFPDEMTVVLEHQFWDLDVKEEVFSVTLTFNGKPEHLTIPFDAITVFADPSVKFGLEFHRAGEASDAASAPSEAKSAIKPKADAKPGEVVALDSFRKK
jgi:hypothetical protein